jgi:hypothetical protein
MKVNDYKSSSLISRKDQFFQNQITQNNAKQTQETIQDIQTSLINERQESNKAMKPTLTNLVAEAFENLITLDKSNIELLEEKKSTSATLTNLIRNGGTNTKRFYFLNSTLKRIEENLATNNKQVMFNQLIAKIGNKLVHKAPNDHNNSDLQNSFAQELTKIKESFQKEIAKPDGKPDDILSKLINCKNVLDEGKSHKEALAVLQGSNNITPTNTNSSSTSSHNAGVSHRKNYKNVEQQKTLTLLQTRNNIRRNLI